MSDPLDRYRRMRDFSATPEPAGAPVGEPPDPGRPRFVVQQHDATRLHWDLRLEHDGVLRSWALPRGIPWHPDRNRLAVHTEDHPIEYLDFHGEIPEDQYGAGAMTIWDRGTYQAEKMEENGVTVLLEGERVRGSYALFPIDGRNWMIHRKDPPHDPERRPPPTLQPMQPVDGSLPADGWSFEVLWVGARVLVTNEPGHVTITDTAGAEISGLFPEVQRIGRALGALECILDAVLVTMQKSQPPRPDAEGIQRRLAASSPSRARRLAQDRPAAALVVDLLWLEGHSTMELPYESRRQLLEELELTGPAWQTPRHHLHGGAALLTAAHEQGLPGLVAKRLDSTYQPGVASADWVAVRAS